MPFAKDRTRRPKGLIPATLGLLVLAAPGCARLQSFQTSPRGGLTSAPPAELASAPDPAAAPPARTDAYADWLDGREPSKRSGTIVRTTRPAPVGGETPAPAAEESTGLITLGTPSDLRGGSGSMPVPNARQAERTSAEAPGTIRPGPVQVAVGPIPAPAPLPPVMPDPVVVNPELIAPLAGPTPAAPAADPLAPFRKAVAEARTRIDSLANYQVRMNRQERVGNDLQEAEDVVLCLRREPRAVRLEWPDGPTRGREVLYTTGGPMHIKMPNNPLMPRMTLAADSPLATRNSRHPIGEAGLENVIAGLETTLARHDAGQNVGQLAYGGIESPTNDTPACHKLVRRSPNGENWLVYLDQQSALPVMIQGTDARGQLLERYLFRDLRPNLPELASNAAFDPDARWGASGGGFFGRLAGATSGAKDKAPTQADATKLR